MNRELNLTVLPNKTVSLEWVETREAITQNSIFVQEKIYERFVNEPDAWLLFLGFCDPDIALPSSLAYFRSVSGAFTRSLSRTPDLEILRHQAVVPMDAEDLSDFTEGVPMMTGSEYIDAGLLENLWSNLNRIYGEQIQEFTGTVEDYFRSYSSDLQIIGRIFFHLVENRDGDYPFAFMATYSAGLNDKGKSRHLPLKHAITQYGDDSDKILDLLKTVYAASEKSPLVSDLIETGELFHPIAWSADEAFRFLKEIPIYEASGILCRIPNWWKGRTKGVSLNINMGEKKPALVGMDAMLSFRPELLIGDMKITEKEARALLESSEGLAFIKNRWVAVDPEKLRKTLEAYEKAETLMAEQGITMKEALRMQLAPENLLSISEEDVALSVSRGEWLQSVTMKMQDTEQMPRIRPGAGFAAKLRGYQEKGLNWLCFLHSLGFGACLADDMGLGKTVQLLGFLSTDLLKKEKKPNLLVVPASLISNWMDEIKKFLPTLNYMVAHPGIEPGKKITSKSRMAPAKCQLVITTYTLVHKYDWITENEWNTVILDEAQAIKNPATQQTKTVKKLNAQNRIILTGTPVENRLSDLWSLFDFLNPGLLGNKTEFGKFSKKLRDNPEGYRRLRRVISPYLLRRLKTDTSIISDLPEKVEMKTYASLSKKQIVLYKNLVKELERNLEEAEGIQRRGLVLSSLMKFKQLCNHPDQFLGTGAYEEKESGKFERLRDICATIYEKREKVLVFTQFKEITDPLCAFLSRIFEREGLVLHGSVPVPKRKTIIESFQSDRYIPFMVLSLKAGGVGLNLTRANHVIHFDRWWNPAVENQATDRAFRIGQQKNVIVHKFLTKGTIEEKIDLMLHEKRELSDKVIASTGETWITELNNKDLMSLFTLNL